MHQEKWKVLSIDENGELVDRGETITAVFAESEEDRDEIARARKSGEIAPVMYESFADFEPDGED